MYKYSLLSIAVLSCLLCIGNCNVFLETHVTLPSVYSKSTFKRISHSSNVPEYNLVLQVPLRDSSMVLYYELSASKPMSFPVYTVDGSAGQRLPAGNRTSGCHYAATLAETPNWSSPGSVSLCGGTIEGVLPLNATHLGYIYPMATGGDAAAAADTTSGSRQHRLNVYPHAMPQSDWHDLDAAYAARATGEIASPISLASLSSFMPPRLHSFLQRQRRSASSGRGPGSKSANSVRLDSPPAPHVTTRGGPFLMELYLVTDADFYAIHNSNVDSVIAAVQNIINFVNNRFRSFNLHIAITTLEIWKTYPAEYDLSVYTDPRKTVDALMRYVSSFPIEWRFDCVHLLHGRSTYYNGKSAGMAKEATMCSRPFCVGFSIVTRDSRNSATAGIIMSHELAHNLGSGHDEDSTGCKCPAAACIMSANLFGSPLHQLPWSDCSGAAVRSFLDSGYRHCLLDPDLGDGDSLALALPLAAGWRAQCGNGIVELGEACDCGGEHGCAGNPCCLAATCQLTPNATCATGACCDLAQCRPRPAGHVCRPAAPSSGDCDLAEYCDGRGDACPADVAVADGTPCDGGTNYCWAGRCPSADRACETIWGHGARSQVADCYSLNVEYQDAAVIFGCRFTRISSSTTVRKMCSEHRGFATCGRLMCRAPPPPSPLDNRLAASSSSSSSSDSMISDDLSGVPVIPGQTRLAGYHTPLSHGVNGVVCRAVAYDYGPVVRDPGLAPSGIGCGDGRLCYSGDCLDAGQVRLRRLDGVDSKADSDCELAGGRMNSRGHCHCPVGRAPPLCAGPGAGGSEDSGPASGAGGRAISDGDSGQGGAAVAGYVAAALLAVVIAAVSAVLLMRYNRQVKECLSDLRCPVELRRLSSRIFSQPRPGSAAAAAAGANGVGGLHNSPELPRHQLMLHNNHSQQQHQPMLHNHTSGSSRFESPATSWSAAPTPMATSLTAPPRRPRFSVQSRRPCGRHRWHPNRTDYHRTGIRCSRHFCNSSSRSRSCTAPLCSTAIP